MSQCSKTTKDGNVRCRGSEGHAGLCFLGGVTLADFDRSAEDSLRSPESPTCVACGQRHGSVGVQIACLGQAILVLRAKLEEKQR